MYNFDEEIEARTGGEWITNSLAHGDNVIVPNDINDPFQILLVDKGPYLVLSNFEDGWGNKWQQGDVVIWGYWYDLLQIGIWTYL